MLITTSRDYHLTHVVRVIRAFILYLFPLLVNACASQPLPSRLSTMSPTAQRPATIYQGRGVAFGVRETMESLVWHTYQLSESSEFRGFIHLLNQRPSEDYFLTCLLDYRQVPCRFDGKQKELIYPISMGDSEERHIPFEMPSVTSGFHDAAVIAFSQVDVHDLSESYRISTDFSYFYAYRLALLTGKEPWQVPPIEFAITGTQPLSPTIRFNGLLVNREQEGSAKWNHAWTVQRVKPGEAIEYYIHMGNDTGPAQVNAVMAFMDFKQIPLNDNKQWVTYISLPAGSRATMSGLFIAPKEPGVHEFMIVWANNPYQKLEEPAWGTERHLTPVDTRVEPSIRVAVVVEK